MMRFALIPLVASFTAPPENDACTPTSNPPKLGCSLPVNIDPKCDCETNTVDGKTYGSVDVSDSTLMELTIETLTADATLTADKCPEGACANPVAYADEKNVYHYATLGQLKPYDAANNRYVLTCAQPTGHKTLKVTVKRPADWAHPTGKMNYFGGEWIQLFQKDSWTREKSEHEPFMHNSHGSIIPLAELRRPTQPWTEDELLTDTMADKDSPTPGSFDTFSVYMNIDNAGDYEFKYGNPNLVHGANADSAIYDTCKGFDTITGEVPLNNPWEATCGTWTTLEFKDKILRVGDPWKTGTQDCGTTGESIVGAGAIVPLFMGHPNLAADKYKNFVDQLTEAKTATSSPMTIYVVLDIFTPKAGMKNGEDTDTSAKVYLDNNHKWTDSKNADTAGTGAAPLDVTYGTCYSSGNKCPDDFRVCEADSCNIDMWKELITDLKKDNKAMGITVKVLGNLDACTDDCVDAEDEGMDVRSVDTLKADVAAYEKYFPDEGATEYIDGYFFSNLNNEDAVTLKTFAAYAKDLKDAGDFIVFSTGAWLKETATLDAVDTLPDVVGTVNGEAENVDVVITLAGKEFGEWNPFAWYPTYSPKTWGAIVNDVEAGQDACQIETVAKMLFDRGYGYVYIQEFDDAGYYGDSGLTSGYFTKLVAAINKKNTGVDFTPCTERRLQTVDTGVATYKWGCDSTEFECAPVCLKTTGVVTTDVAKSYCAGVAPDPCGCKCLFEAAWTCSGDTVVCEATNSLTLERSNVGSLVCSSRSSVPKPSISSFTQRVADKCENKPVPSFTPSSECMERAKITKAGRDEHGVAHHHGGADHHGAGDHGRVHRVLRCDGDSPRGCDARVEITGFPSEMEDTSASA
jgi:hypothetical protein